MICNTILDPVGHTPLVRLNRMTTPDTAEVLVKFEALNVGGSIKTRTAFNMIRDAETRGLLRADSIIVEPTSGNQGIGLALIGAVRGYETVIVMPDSVSEERRKLVRHYGAKVILVHDAGHQATSLRVAFAPNLGADELVRSLRSFECGRVIAKQRDGGNQGRGDAHFTQAVLFREIIDGNLRRRASPHHATSERADGLEVCVHVLITFLRYQLHIAGFGSWVISQGDETLAKWL